MSNILGAASMDNPYETTAKPSDAVEYRAQVPAQVMRDQMHLEQMARLDCVKLALMQWGSGCKYVSEVLDKADVLYAYVQTGRVSDNG